MRMDQLQHFYTLSQCNSFTRAADQLYITQSALSKSIKALETELHLDLLHRNTRTVTLTAEGVAFAESCSILLKNLRDGINNAKFASGAISGRVIMGLSSDRFDIAAVNVISKINEICPGIITQLTFFPANGLLRALDNNGVDFIFSSDWPRSSNLKCVRISKSTNCAVLSKTHKLATEAELEFEQLKSENILAISHAISGKEHDLIIELARAANLSPHLVYEANTISELLMLVAVGKGVTILSDEYRVEGNDIISFIPLKDAPFKEEHIIWKESDNPCIKAIETIAEGFKF